MKALSGFKMPALHPHSWSLDIIDGKRVGEENTPSILCGLWCVDWLKWQVSSLMAMFLGVSCSGRETQPFICFKLLANLHTLYQLLHRQAMFSDNNRNWALSRWILMPLTSPLMVLVLQGFLFGMLMVPLSSPCPMVDHLASMLAAEATAATDCLQLVLSWRHHKVILKSN
jgi:predicted branched-subunit amino acid permease